MENAAWLSPGVTLTGMRMFECGKKTPEECAWYQQRWHFWSVIILFFHTTAKSIIDVLQVCCRLCLCCTDRRLLHEWDWYIHHCPFRFFDSSTAAKQPTNIAMAKISSCVTVPVISWFPCATAPMELCAYWSTFAGRRRHNILFL